LPRIVAHAVMSLVGHGARQEDLTSIRSSANPNVFVSVECGDQLGWTSRKQRHQRRSRESRRQEISRACRVRSHDAEPGGDVRPTAHTRRGGEGTELMGIVMQILLAWAALLYYRKMKRTSQGSGR